jgi:hypothetical protein
MAARRPAQRESGWDARGVASAGSGRLSTLSKRNGTGRRPPRQRFSDLYGTGSRRRTASVSKKAHQRAAGSHIECLYSDTLTQGGLALVRCPPVCSWGLHFTFWPVTPLYKLFTAGRKTSSRAQAPPPLRIP